MKTRPDRTEAAPFYFTYIDQVPDGDIVERLEAQGREVLDLLRGISDAQSQHRYAADKWSIHEVLNHINDTERVFTFRALWFARGFESPLPSFDQNVGVAAARADEVAWPVLVDEFRALREATLALFRTLPDEAWARRGVASDKQVSVKALAYMVAGHVIHHLKILRERYLDIDRRV
jgi:uncharacterized damage-inducible protein DinB